jgi:hypothetical protein
MKVMLRISVRTSEGGAGGLPVAEGLASPSGRAAGNPVLREILFVSYWRFSIVRGFLYE